MAKSLDGVLIKKAHTRTSYTEEQLKELLGRGRAKKGMFEGDLIEGELEIGQIAGGINKIQTVQEVIDELIFDYNNAIKTLEKNYL